MSIGKLSYWNKVFGTAYIRNLKLSTDPGPQKVSTNFQNQNLYDKYIPTPRPGLLLFAILDWFFSDLFHLSVIAWIRFGRPFSEDILPKVCFGFPNST